MPGWDDVWTTRWGKRPRAPAGGFRRPTREEEGLSYAETLGVLPTGHPGSGGPTQVERLTDVAATTAQARALQPFRKEIAEIQAQARLHPAHEALFRMETAQHAAALAKVEETNRLDEFRRRHTAQYGEAPKPGTAEHRHYLAAEELARTHGAEAGMQYHAETQRYKQYLPHFTPERLGIPQEQITEHLEGPFGRQWVLQVGPRLHAETQREQKELERRLAEPSGVPFIGP
jgi:hypothetical protein